MMSGSTSQTISTGFNVHCARLTHWKQSGTGPIMTTDFCVLTGVTTRPPAPLLSAEHFVGGWIVTHRHRSV
jgi:hypothetical protein